MRLNFPSSRRMVSRKAQNHFRRNHQVRRPRARRRTSTVTGLPESSPSTSHGRPGSLGPWTASITIEPVTHVRRSGGSSDIPWTRIPRPYAESALPLILVLPAPCHRRGKLDRSTRSGRTRRCGSSMQEIQVRRPRQRPACTLPNEEPYRRDSGSTRLATRRLLGGVLP
jgi:hypothetical protein